MTSSRSETPRPSATPEPTERDHNPQPSSETPTPSPEPASEPSPPIPAPRINASIEPGKIKEYAAQSRNVRKLIDSSLELAQRDITYTYGSADPANGGMDCSGFIYYTLRQNGFSNVPRSASEQYVWARKSGAFRAVVSQNPDSFELDELRPGDLLFWVGTYATQHDPPVSHTMIYLGTETDTGHRIMVGSSNGRTYHGKKRNGVSVFDFTIPRSAVPANRALGVRTSEEINSHFVGYSHIPGL